MRDMLQLCLVLSVIALAGCSGSDEDGVRITGPEFSEGPGRVYSINEITFSSNDGVPISALFGASASTERLPTVILLHDLGGNKQEWLTTTDLLIELLERGYAVVAVDMRGHGQTPLPDDRQVLLIEDLENSVLDIFATLNWLLRQPAVDPNRIAVIGDGSGGNVAFVSSGVFTEQIKTSVSLSPGLWESSSLSPLVIGRGISPFAPRSILYLVGAMDQLEGPETVLSYADFARNLEAVTAQPTSLRIFQNSAAHGIDLINEVPEAKDLLFLWLENNL